MAFFITTLAHALVPLALAVALLPVIVPARPAADAGTPATYPVPLTAGLAAGALLALVAAIRAAETSIGTGLHAVVFGMMAVALLLLIAAPLLRRPAVDGLLRRLAAPLLVAALAAQGLYDTWDMSATRSLTATGVVNTELIVNLAAIALGVALMIALAVVARHVGRLAGARAAGAVLAGVLLVECVTGSAQIMLGLLRLDAITVTGGRISYVAKVSMAEPWAVYANLGLALVLAAIAYAHRLRLPAPPPQDAPRARIEHRKQRAVARGQRRWRNGLAGTAAFLLVTLLYQDLYATLPPALSPAAPVEADAAGDIRIPIDQVKDGKLHRFAYIASDGHRVRFFLINRYDPEHVHMGVVYDACMICGDDGYVQRGDEIICIACNVRIFRPSIGKGGGCNPLPLPHAVEDGAVVITTAELEKGARYFSEVVEISVTDPVTGATLTNTDARYQHKYDGRTYFFEGQESYEQFRDAPESFLSDVQAGAASAAPAPGG